MAGENKLKIQREAEKFVIQGKIQQAIAEYQKIIKIDPEDVLTLNTIGDLCLRMGKPQDASTYFSRVADHYARENFLLKAIAVYKKILSCDPQNLGVHKTLASLYAKQGLNVEARNEFLRVAEISTIDGKSAEAQQAYEKVAELDPLNVSAQLKLADISLKEGSKDKAHFYLVAAAKARAKADDYAEAMTSYQHALELKPDDVKTMSGLLDAAIRVGKVPPALELLKKSLESGFETIELLELMAKAYLSDDDLTNAAAIMQRLVAMDESRYVQFLELQKRLLDRKDLDAAATCLDPVIPILIEKRATKRAIEAYQSIVARLPDHLPSLTRLADLYSAANDQANYLATLDRVAQRYLDHKQDREALVFLEKILQASPASEKHLRLHRQTFENVFPGIPYTPPVNMESTPAHEVPSGVLEEVQAAQAGAKGASPALVEVDLLLTYGMKDKALDVLRTAETRDPSDIGVRLRLLALYKENNQLSLAAEECLYLALAYRKMGDEEATQKYIDEAGSLDPAVVGSRPELLSLAYQQGSSAGPALRVSPALGSEAAAGAEVDLSEDLSEIFFKDQRARAGAAEVAPPVIPHDDMVEEFVPTAVRPRPTATLLDQLQEVDFYIRLGFYDEARAKLTELEKEHPGHPDLRLRQNQIAESPGQPVPSPVEGAGVADAIEVIPEESVPVEESFDEDLKLIEEPPQEVDFALQPAAPEAALTPEPAPAAAHEATTDAVPPPAPKPLPSAAQEEVSAAVTQPAAQAPPPKTGPAEPKGMFSDLLEEVNSMTDQDIAREEYETHFSLGIAYREMSLNDEAIKEFQEAMKVLSPAKQPRETIQCCGMLSTCFLDKGMPRSAIRWCETGLAIPEISQHESMALSYDMGVALAALGEADKALEWFTTLQKTDPSYRDVVHKIEELRGSSGQHVT